MKPLLVTTPRTSSTLVTVKLSNIAIDNFNYIKNINEYFNIINIVKTNYYLRDNIIQQDPSIRIYKKWTDDIYSIQLERLNMLKINPNYMIKLFPINIHPEVENFIVNNYDLIFLERRDKISQFLSFLGLYCGAKEAHNSKHNRYKIEYLHYDPKYLDIFTKMYDHYIEFKRKYFKGHIIYYEDIESNISEEIICKKLNLNVKTIINRINSFDKTVYTKEKEELIINKDQWLADKHKIQNIIT